MDQKPIKKRKATYPENHPNFKLTKLTVGILSRLNSS